MPTPGSVFHTKNLTHHICSRNKLVKMRKGGKWYMLSTSRTAHQNAEVISPANPSSVLPSCTWKCCGKAAEPTEPARPGPGTQNRSICLQKQLLTTSQARECFIHIFSNSLALSGGSRQIARSVSWLLTGHIPECYEWPSQL